MEQRDREQGDLRSRRAVENTGALDACGGPGASGARRVGYPAPRAPSLRAQQLLAHAQRVGRPAREQIKLEGVLHLAQKSSDLLRRTRTRFQRAARPRRLLGDIVVDQQPGRIDQFAERRRTALLDERVWIKAGWEEDAAPEHPRREKYLQCAQRRLASRRVAVEAGKNVARMAPEQP